MSPGSCPRGGTWGHRGGGGGGGAGGSKNFFSQIQPGLVCELLTWMAHATAQVFGSPPPGWGLGEGPKRSNIIKSQLQSQFQRFFI